MLLQARRTRGILIESELAGGLLESCGGFVLVEKPIVAGLKFASMASVVQRMKEV